jgi:lipopolysaccharide assembly outer membrane protein LptD (OstA)
VQVPHGKVQAQGKIKVTATNLEAVSDSLTINLQEEQIYLEGKVQIIQRQSEQEFEVRGDRLTLSFNKREAYKTYFEKR